MRGASQGDLSGITSILRNLPEKEIMSSKDGSKEAPPETESPKAEKKMVKVPRRIQSMGIDPGRGPGESSVMFVLATDSTLWFRVAPGSPESYWVQIEGLPESEVEVAGDTPAGKLANAVPFKPGQPRTRPMGGDTAPTNRPHSGL